MTRVYGPATWDVYDQLDASMEPEGPDELLDLAGQHLASGHVVLDAGCRDGAYLIELVQRFDVTAVGVEPVPIHVERARAAVREAGLVDRVEVVESTVEAFDSAETRFDLIWCRDVLEQVGDLNGVVGHLARRLAPDGVLLVFTVVTTERLSAAEHDLLASHLGNVAENLDRTRLEAAFASAGLVVDRFDVVGTRWREYAEERMQPVSTALLRLARLRRQRAALVEQHGGEIIGHVEANLHWEVFQFLGKLEPMVFVLRARR